MQGGKGDIYNLRVGVLYAIKYAGWLVGLLFFCTHLHSFKYSYLIQIIYEQIYGIKYSYLIMIIICTQFYGFK